MWPVVFNARIFLKSTNLPTIQHKTIKEFIPCASIEWVKWCEWSAWRVETCSDLILSPWPSHNSLMNRPLRRAPQIQDSSSDRWHSFRSKFPRRHDIWIQENLTWKLPMGEVPVLSPRYSMNNQLFTHLIIANFYTSYGEGRFEVLESK